MANSIVRHRHTLTKDPKINGGHTVLIIEDQEAASAALKQLLVERLNVNVDIAHSFQEAKAKLKQHRHEYLVAVCDLHLPDAPNGEILGLVNKAKVRAIALTGIVRECMHKCLKKALLIDYVEKDAPNSVLYVVGLVERLCKNQKVRALIVDDSPTALLLLERIMLLLNFNVLKASNGRDALDILNESSDIRLLITDHEMPDMSGFELVIKARALYDKDHLAIIGLSAHSQIELGASFIKYGANDFLSKPIEFQNLLCRVNMNMEVLEHLDYIHELADKDSLTKLHNRRFFFEHGKPAIENAHKTKANLVVAILDIDFFKKINDEYGHDCGDQALRHFAILLAQTMKDHLVARFGGEEFVVLFQDIEPNAAQSKLNEFCKLIKDTPFKWLNCDISFTVSTGAVVAKTSVLDEALKLADDNLYKAKQNGRDQVVMTHS
ncbi:response regulator [Pseudoalteromonas sp. A25]|uniref:response regulator n=1 Tax=Pseudoalteromonas sp. A25 TaxID=116092 RepID=UPI001562E91A|nr:response regulator [Pseudoalteromonas sp. A25]